MATGNCISCASTLLFLRLLSAQPAGMHCTVQLSFILLINIHTVICAALCRWKPSGVLIRSHSIDRHSPGAIRQLGMAIFILGGWLAMGIYLFSTAYYCESAAVAMISCQDTIVLSRPPSKWKVLHVSVGANCCLLFLFAFATRVLFTLLAFETLSIHWILF